MVTGTLLSVGYNHVSSFYRQNECQLGKSLLRFANGKRVEQPSDSIPDYFYASRLKQSRFMQDKVKSEMSDALARI
ncbi:MAG TPA: hypothetical protein VHO70_01470, partial [Chitinispirillaceae bacterium]|nr:hypothetical protein [Chitinispirillaceae bacterium]